MEVIKEALKRLNYKREIEYFKNGTEFLDYLRQSKEAPFLIICDLYLPGETGFDLKERLANDRDLKYKTVPFVYWSISASEEQIKHAYDLPAQGFFLKPHHINDLYDTLKTIIDYWEKSKHPKTVS